MRLCPEHALQLNYRKNKEALKAQKHARREEQARQERRQRKRKKSESFSATPEKPLAAKPEAVQGLEEEANKLRTGSSTEPARADAGVDDFKGQTLVQGSDDRREDSQAGDLAAGSRRGRRNEGRGPVAAIETPETVSSGPIKTTRSAEAGGSGEESRQPMQNVPLDRRKGIYKDDRWQMAGSSAHDKGGESSMIDDDVLFADLFL